MLSCSPWCHAYGEPLDTGLGNGHILCDFTAAHTDSADDGAVVFEGVSAAENDETIRVGGLETSE